MSEELHSEESPSAPPGEVRAGPIFEIRGARKLFDDKLVLDAIDLDLARDEIVALIGPSGCGKTVLLKCLVGLLPLDAGEICFDGKPLSAMNDAQRSEMRGRVGLMFQYNALFDSMTVGENVAYGLHEGRAHTLSEREVDERVEWALASVAMTGTQSLRTDELSGGMRKRVGLARTMALRPEVILYDEPTMGLDPVNSHRIGSLIEELHRTFKIASVMVTHDMKLAFKVADRVAMMYEGRLLGVDTPDAMKNHPDQRVRDFITGTDRADAL